MGDDEPTGVSAVGTVNKQFFVELGARIAARRRDKGITQVQLAQALGFSQPQIHSFESGRRRIQVSLLPVLAEFLDISVENLLGIEDARRGRGRPSRLQWQFEQVSQLPKKKQQLVSEMIDALLLQSQQAVSG